MIVYRFRSKNIIYDSYLPKKQNGKVILYVPGLPGHPRKKALGEALAKKGFIFFEMRYPGSWESDGNFTFDNCVKSISKAYIFILKGRAIELRRNILRKWDTKKIILLGSSFGGGVVLSSRIRSPLQLVVLAPITNLNHLRKSLYILSTGDDDLYTLLTRGYKNVYRGLTRKDWNNFLAGKTLINPEKNIQNLKNKRLLIIQGAGDDVIMPIHTEQYVASLRDKKIDITSITIKGVSHGSTLEQAALRYLLKI